MEEKLFSSEEWLEEFQETIKELKPKTNSLRMKIQHGTWSTFSEYKYVTELGEAIKLDKGKILENIKAGKMYKEDYIFSNVSKCENSIIEVCNRDCLEVAYELKQKGMKPVVLNMANARTPGGGYRSGSGAQEENLHRRSNYFQYLEDAERLFPERTWYYPIPEFGAVYSPDVVVIRGSEKRGYPFINPHTMSMIACAAYSRPHTVTRNGKIMLSEEYAENTKMKMRTILRTGLDNGHDSIVLSAFGCGAYRNPPEHIALLFKEVLNEIEFISTYKHISFSILDDHNTGKQHNPDGNFQPFFKIFDSQ